MKSTITVCIPLLLQPLIVVHLHVVDLHDYCYSVREKSNNINSNQIIDFFLNIYCTSLHQGDFALSTFINDKCEGDCQGTHYHGFVFVSYR